MSDVSANIIMKWNLQRIDILANFGDDIPENHSEFVD